jgi:hypothetical protein
MGNLLALGAGCRPGIDNGPNGYAMVRAGGNTGTAPGTRQGIGLRLRAASRLKPEPNCLFIADIAATSANHTIERKTGRFDIDPEAPGRGGGILAECQCMGFTRLYAVAAEGAVSASEVDPRITPRATRDDPRRARLDALSAAVALIQESRFIYRPGWTDVSMATQRIAMKELNSVDGCLHKLVSVKVAGLALTEKHQ